MDSSDIGMFFDTTNGRRAVYCGDVLQMFMFYDEEKYGTKRIFVDLASGNFFTYDDSYSGFYGVTFNRTLFDSYSHGFNREGVYIDSYLD